jgi:rRNA-processing protein FCF1
MAQVVIDTNVFLSIFELETDFITEIESNYGKNLVTLQSVLDELVLKGQNGRMALQLLEKRKIRIFEHKPDLPVDDQLLSYCEANSAILATQDARLVERAKHKHLKTISIRQRTLVR